jgi:hypothetical protein
MVRAVSVTYPSAWLACSEVGTQNACTTRTGSHRQRAKCSQPGDNYRPRKSALACGLDHICMASASNCLLSRGNALSRASQTDPQFAQSPVVTGQVWAYVLCTLNLYIDKVQIPSGVKPTSQVTVPVNDVMLHCPCQEASLAVTRI